MVAINNENESRDSGGVEEPEAWLPTIPFVSPGRRIVCDRYGCRVGHGVATKPVRMCHQFADTRQHL